MTRLTTSSFLLIALTFFVGCGARPKLPDTVALPTIPIGEEGQPEVALNQNGYISLDDVKDSRTSLSLMQYDGKNVSAQGSVPAHVKTAIEAAFRKSGVSLSDAAPLIIAPQLMQWDVKVDTEGTDTAQSLTSLHIEVLDPANKPVYSARYEGNSHTSRGSIHEKDLQSLLATSMAEALKQLMADKKLMKLISSF